MTALGLVNPTGISSGAEQVLLRVAHAARRGGWEATVAAPPGPLADEVAKLGLPYRRVPDLKLTSVPKPAAALLGIVQSARAAFRLRRFGRDLDLLVLNGLTLLPAARLSRPACPVVWLVHEVVRGRARRALVRFGAPGVDLAIAVSEAAAASIRSSGIPVQVVRNGTTWPVEAAPRPRARPPIVGQVALLTPPKGHAQLLEAVARLRDREVVVELVGDTMPRHEAVAEKLRTRAARPDLVGRVRFVGRVDDALTRMRTWTVAVLASTGPEAAPLTVLEAMSIGVPVVATDHGGTPEVLGDAGLLVPPDDPGALARALERLLDDRELYERCAQAGPRLVAARFTTDRQERELLGVLAQVVARSSAGRRRLRHLGPELEPRALDQRP